MRISLSLIRLMMVLTLYFTTTSVLANSTIVRHKVADFPISSVVEVPGLAKTYYLSGVVPARLADGSYGKTTEEQAVNILNTIKATLRKHSLSLKDIVKMQVFLVADPKLGKMDFDGFMKGYSQFFATQSQPNAPARSVMEVKALALPEWLIEIEVIAAK